MLVFFFPFAILEVHGVQRSMSLLGNHDKFYQLPDENTSFILLQMDWSKPNILQTAEVHAKLFSTCRWSVQIESRLRRTVA